MLVVVVVTDPLALLPQRIPPGLIRSRQIDQESRAYTQRDYELESGLVVVTER